MATNTNSTNQEPTTFDRFDRVFVNALANISEIDVPTKGVFVRFVLLVFEKET